MIEINREKFIAGAIITLCLLSLIVGLSIIWQIPSTKAKQDALPNLVQRSGVTIVYLYGPLYVSTEMRWGSLFRGTDRVVEQLRQIQKDARVKAVILRINSPGGSVAAVQEIYEEVIKLKKTGKKVIISIGDVAASGGYYIAVAGDRIMANPGSLTGSVGVYMESPNLEGLLKKVGIKMEIVKSGKYKDIGSPYREISYEERKILEELIGSAYSQFLNTVIRDRNLDRKGAGFIREGQIYTGEQAKKLGLIDDLGNMQDAIRLAGELGGIKGEPHIIEVVPPVQRFFDLLIYNLARNFWPMTVEISSFPRLSYIWK